MHGLSDCLARGVKILDGMKCSPLLFSTILLTLGSLKFSLVLACSSVIIMLFLQSYEVHIMLNKSL